MKHSKLVPIVCLNTELSRRIIGKAAAGLQGKIGSGMQNGTCGAQWELA